METQLEVIHISDSTFIKDTAARFLRHLRSIERLLEQDLLDKPVPENMELGEFISYVLYLKYRRIEATQSSDKEELKDIELKFEEISEGPLFTLIDKKVAVEVDENDFVYKIDSTLLKNAYLQYKENKTDESYEQSQYQNSLVISLVIGMELLIADIFKDFIHNLDVSNQVIKDKPLTYDDLRNFNSVEDAKIFLLDQYIENLLRNSFDSWIVEFEDKMKINVLKIHDLKTDINVINETFQRRHLIIHNEGIVNDLYIKKVDEKLTNNVVKGEILHLDRKYIKLRLSTFRKFGLILLYLYGVKKHRKELDKLFEDYHGLLVGILDKSCDGVRYIFEQFSESDIDHSYRLMSKINYFLSYKLVNDDSIDSTINVFDTGALSIEYKMAKSILLDRAEAEKEVIEYLKGSNDDHFISVLEWPLLKLLKRTSKLNAYTKRRYKSILKKEMGDNYAITE